jgi:hypothetical protein
MIYVLLWVGLRYGYTTSGSAEFSSFQSCEKAKTVLVSLHSSSHDIKAVCVPK